MIEVSEKTLGRLKEYESQNKLSNHSFAIEKLLDGQSRTKRRGACCWRSFCCLFYLFLFLFGIVLAVQMHYFIFFPSYYTLERPEGLKVSRVMFYADPQIEGDARILREGFYGRFHVHFNDYYMKWVYWRTMSITEPDLQVFLGDMVSSQYINYIEFNKRVRRLKWIFDQPNNIKKNSIKTVWLSGNHDIGYGYDCTSKQLNRYESAFHSSDQYFEYLGHRWLTFNSQLLEGVKEEKLQNVTVDHIQRHGEHHVSTFGTPDYLPMIMLDHIPFHKAAGICTDPPHILYDASGAFIAHQNMISENMTNWLLNFKPVLIFNGHDHNGCYYFHQVNEDFGTHEYTIRSMMGEFGGFSALLEFAKNDLGEYEYKVFLIPFMTTDETLAALFVIIVWFSLLVIPILPKALYLLIGCCFFCRRRRRTATIKTKIE